MLRVQRQERPREGASGTGRSNPGSSRELGVCGRSQGLLDQPAQGHWPRNPLSGSPTHVCEGQGSGTTWDLVQPSQPCSRSAQGHLPALHQGCASEATGPSPRENASLGSGRAPGGPASFLIIGISRPEAAQVREGSASEGPTVVGTAGGGNWRAVGKAHLRVC